MARRIARFLRQYPSISSQKALEEFKDIARSNMYFALIQIAILSVGALAAVMIIISGRIEAIIAVVLVYLAAAWYNRSLKSLEESVRSLNVSPDLMAEYEHVCDSWFNRPWPNF